MAQKAPGKSFRKGLTLIAAKHMFPDDKTTEKWFEKQRWGDNIHCPRCGSLNIHSGTTHPTMPHRCRDCRKYFSVKTGSVMEGSNLGYQIWALAMYLLQTGLKGQSSMKLHRDFGITQKAAWHLAHRIREVWTDSAKPPFPGPVEADETYIGGKRKNMPKHKRAELTGRGAAGKSIVAGAKDRATKNVSATVIEATDKATLHGFIVDRVADGSTVYTDDHRGYKAMPFDHESVNHSAGEYVKGKVHTNGIESFWAMLKRGYQGTYHQMSAKHLHRYVTEFSGRQNNRSQDTIDQMAGMARAMVGKRLRYKDLTGSK